MSMIRHLNELTFGRLAVWVKDRRSNNREDVSGETCELLSNLRELL